MKKSTLVSISVCVAIVLSIAACDLLKDTNGEGTKAGQKACECFNAVEQDSSASTKCFGEAMAAALEAKLRGGEYQANFLLALKECGMDAIVSDSIQNK